MSVFELPIRVYYEDTDAGGVVYHSIYLNYMERARTEWLMRRNINLHMHAITHKEMFVVKSLMADYKSPAHLCDDLIVKTTIEKQTKARVFFRQEIYREETLLVSGLVEIVCLDTETRKPIPLPNIFQ